MSCGRGSQTGNHFNSWMLHLSFKMKGKCLRWKKMFIKVCFLVDHLYNWFIMIKTYNYKKKNQRRSMVLFINENSRHFINSCLRRCLDRCWLNTNYILFFMLQYLLIETQPLLFIRWLYFNRVNMFLPPCNLSEFRFISL